MTFSQKQTKGGMLMEEEVLWLDLPEDTEYQKVMVAGKMRGGIAYVEECTCQQKEKVKLEIPKPKSLVGGSEVYQSDDVPYWYCKIKGRDTFMHVYMEDLTEEDLLYDSKTGKKRKFSTDREKKYKKDVLEALENKPKEGFRWISVYEPSPTPNGSVQFVEGEEPLRGFSCFDWDKMLEEYSPENESRMISKTTYFLLSLRWLKDGFATLEQLANHSEKIGHYRDSENATIGFERTGKRRFGGLYGFVGNTGKIVKDSNSASGYSLLSSDYEDCGNDYQFSYVHHVELPGIKYFSSVAWSELKK